MTDTTTARRTVTAHAWAMGYGEADPFGDDDIPTAAEACGRLSDSKLCWNSAEWIVAEAAHEAQALRDTGDHETADAIACLLTAMAEHARPRKGSATTADVMAAADAAAR